MLQPAPGFLAIASHPFKFRFFLLTKLPSAYFTGVRIRSIDAAQATVSVPYKWFSKNPFRSTYFACLAMAAEMSTGALAMAYLYQRKPAVSMLVTALEATYFKKATELTFFTCSDGHALCASIEEAISDGLVKTFTATSTGLNDAGETIAVFKISWSFKLKSR